MRLKGKVPGDWGGRKVDEVSDPIQPGEMPLTTKRSIKVTTRK